MRAIGWLISWTFFWMGHIVSKPMYRFDGMAWLYPTYNNLMHWSLRAQDATKASGPWEEPTNDN